MRGGLLYQGLQEVLVPLLSLRIRPLYGQMAAIFFRFLIIIHLKISGLPSSTDI